MAKTQKTVTKDGYAIFRKTQQTVPEGRFRDNMNLRRVIIPSHIKEIRRCAFINCRNLEHVYFEDGDLAYIHNHAFAGCESLRSLTVPEETLVFPFAFQGCTGLEQPIRSESGDAFYAYPQGWQLTQYTVPSGVNTIASTAFLENHALEEVILPESVDRLAHQAFYESGIKRITIPAGVKRISENTFVNCRHLETVTLLGDTKIAYNAFPGAPETLQIVSKVRHIPAYEKYWAIGATFLAPQKTELPPPSHWEDPKFEALAQDCADGDPAAMWNMAQHFESQNRKDPHPFYPLSANHWRFFAMLAGNTDAIAWFRNWEVQNPNSKLPAVLDESRSGTAIDGSIYCHLGYPFFQPHVLYDVFPTTKEGIALVCAHPHSDDIWDYTNYETTFLDEYFRTLPIGTVYHNPEKKPDLPSCVPYSLKDAAQTAALKRNWHKRAGKPYYHP